LHRFPFYFFFFSVFVRNKLCAYSGSNFNALGCLEPKTSRISILDLHFYGYTNIILFGYLAICSHSLFQMWRSEFFFWRACVKRVSQVNGVSQETCRDFGHLSYGLASTFNVAETALIQGVDLYTPNADRLLVGG
jgi:hypothetical protein